MTPTTDYGRAVEALLAETGLTAYGLAKKAGLTQQAVLDVMHRRRADPHITTFAKMLAATGRPWAFLDRFDQSARPGCKPLTAWEWQVLRELDRRIRKRQPARRQAGGLLYDAERKKVDAAMVRRLVAAGFIEADGEPDPLTDEYDTTPPELRTKWRLTMEGRFAADHGEGLSPEGEVWSPEEEG